MRQSGSPGNQVKTFHGHELGMDLNVINRESFSNFDRWNMISLLGRTYSPERQDLYDQQQQKILIADLKCERGLNLKLSDPSIFGFLEVLNISQYDLSTITLWNVWDKLQGLAWGDRVGKYDVHSGLNKILKASIRPGGLDALESFLKASKLGSLKEASAQPSTYRIDENEKYNTSGNVYQSVVSLVIEDKQEMDSDYAFSEFDMYKLFISTSIESCYKNLSKSCNIARKIHGTSPDENEHYGAIINLIYISCNGESVIEFQPDRPIEIFEEKNVVLQDYQFTTAFTGEDPELIKTIIATPGSFHRKVRAKILENDLGM